MGLNGRLLKLTRLLPPPAVRESAPAAPDFWPWLRAASAEKRDRFWGAVDFWAGLSKTATGPPYADAWVGEAAEDRDLARGFLLLVEKAEAAGDDEDEATASARVAATCRAGSRLLARIATHVARASFSAEYDLSEKSE